MVFFRQGLLGRITLETPEQFGAWSAAALAAVQEAAEQTIEKE